MKSTPLDSCGLSGTGTGVAGSRGSGTGTGAAGSGGSGGGHGSTANTHQRFDR